MLGSTKSAALAALLASAHGAGTSKDFPPGWNGLARTPPMGWRSWNAFGNRITEDMMLEAADALVAKTRQGPTAAADAAADAAAASLCDFGYCSVGIDEGWEGCGAGVNGTQHDAAGNPTIKTSAFPDLSAVVKYGHFQGLHVGWYENGCACGEKTALEINYEGDVRNLHDLGFDGVKLDGCGKQRNLTLYAALMRDSGKNYTIENCHWGRCTDSDDSSCPTADWCPFNWYRTSGDINAGSQSWYANLQTATRFLDADAPLSVPGCWAYPDMLEVGRVAEPGADAGTTSGGWNRAHFGAWCVISAPLILGLDITNEAQLTPILPIITNAEAIAVNQQWAGHPGRLVRTWPNAGPNSTAPSGYAWGEACSAADATQRGWAFDDASGHLTAPSGACLAHSTADYGDTALEELPCTTGGDRGYGHGDGGGKNQQWKRDGASLVDAATGKNCLDLFGGQACASAPRANLYKCNGGKNQQWNVTADGQLVNGCGACIGSKPTPPPGASRGGGGANEVQLWAKPQPGKAVAALVINNSPTPYTARIELAALGIKAGAARVRDIWAKADAGTTTGAFLLSTVAAYDSAFLLFTPA